VERRPVDRPATGADNLFQERTLEATESAEEAVVSKEARVTGEVRLKKTAEEEARTISDKVRKTEVEIEDERRASGGTTGATRTSTTPQRGGPDRGA
jgi:stress response protein YsnF